eukprot:CAMPEP_0201489314 /NCGR_PEP_ID=MMETSP0151_2-20130828/21957_1 /ASSEMBLY_ACC=CAM_ASM_000257 /TAXON_ID=200890 /ORGANISM="Paramoeba atlantica, Strain 621/1 / CCAP 1560/9" /LENGTH=244 /DNA_ID=CAMNT_0047874861 /DNA_START=29 /DNA_END=763 /DNA_ORIENTATION=+
MAATQQEDMRKFKEITATQNIDEQAMTFLRAFVGEFQGKFEEVLALGEKFKTYAPPGGNELDEFEAHRFLESLSETKTVRDMRECLQTIDLDFNKKVAFIEYCLFKYKKSVRDLFSAKPNAAALAKLEKAVNQYRAVFEEKKQREAKMEDLRQKAANGDVKAKSELKRMEMAGSEVQDTKNEMFALQQKLAAKRAMKNPEEEQQKMIQEEERKLAEEKARKEAEEKKQKDDSRARLAARAAMFK